MEAVDLAREVHITAVYTNRQAVLKELQHSLEDIVEQAAETSGTVDYNPNNRVAAENLSAIQLFERLIAQLRQGHDEVQEGDLRVVLVSPMVYTGFDAFAQSGAWSVPQDADGNPMSALSVIMGRYRDQSAAVQPALPAPIVRAALPAPSAVQADNTAADTETVSQRTARLREERMAQRAAVKKV
jgi:hypothetical protein